MTASPAFQNPDCYARELGGCSSDINREHYVSEAILELVEGAEGETSGTVRASGLSFLRGTPRPLGVSRLTAKILCQDHNGALSPFDTAGKAMYCAVDRLNTLASTPAAPNEVLTVPGDDLERWMLKTLCGGLYSGAFLVNPGEGMKDISPPRAWLEILFNGTQFPPGQGVYWVPSKAGAVITADPMVLKLSPLVADDDRTVIGLRTWFFGFQFTLLAAPLKAVVMTEFAAEWYRPTGLTERQCKASIRFAWKDYPHGQDVLVERVRP